MSSKSAAVPFALPPHAVAWFQSQGVDPEEAMTLPSARFVRAVGAETLCGESEVADLCEDLGLSAADVKPVTWMPKPLRFWALPRDAPLARARSIKLGLLQGMDAASGACVAALDVRPGHRVLDLCCSPGAKFLALLDCLHDDSLKCEGASDDGSRDETVDGARSSLISTVRSISEGCLDGIDVSEGRLRVCRSLVAKALESRWAPPAMRSDAASDKATADRLRVRLVCSDGRHWAGLLGKAVDLENEQEGLGQLVFDSAAHYAELAGRRPPKMKTTSVTGDARKHASIANSSVNSSTNEQSCSGEVPRKRLNKSARAREAKRLKALTHDSASGFIKSDQTNGPSTAVIYDRVLVDADCSTDGSAKHLGKVLMGCADENGVEAGEASGSKTSSSGSSVHESSVNVDRKDFGCQRLEELLSPEATARHVSTQSLLLANGFKLLAPGGILVYATCSLTHAQNEGVVAVFLAQEPKAALAPVPFAVALQSNRCTVQRPEACHNKVIVAPQTDAVTGAANEGGDSVVELFPWAPGGLPHTLRFSARRGTSGLFLARIMKQST